MTSSMHCPSCRVLVTLPHNCPNYTGTPDTRLQRVYGLPSAPTYRDPLERIADSLEQLVEIFRQAEDTQNRRLPRDA